MKLLIGDARNTIASAISSTVAGLPAGAFSNSFCREPVSRAFPRRGVSTYLLAGGLGQHILIFGELVVDHRPWTDSVNSNTFGTVLHCILYVSLIV